MANVKKCDRCGRIYEENKSVFQNKKVTGVALACGKRSMYCGSVKELCDDCIDELKAWLQNCNVASDKYGSEQARWQNGE